VLAHASEPYVSRIDFLPSMGSALLGIELVAQNLRRAVFEPLNYEARTNMMYASYISAQAFNSGGLGIIHSISHAVSAFYDSHHGLNNAIGLTRVWEFNMQANYKRFRDIAKAMGENVDGPVRCFRRRAGGGSRHSVEQRPQHPGQLHQHRPVHQVADGHRALCRSGQHHNLRRECRTRRGPHHQACIE
jgi:hypothetical protein